jgi:hypothetical protein
VLYSEVGAIELSGCCRGVIGIMGNLRRDLTGVGLASDELLPRLSTLTDDISGIPIAVLAIYRYGQI